jgi:ribulose-phosphate 3-epimerase
MEIKVIPSIIAKSQKELVDKIERVWEFADNIHLDIMDGVFVSDVSLNFDFKLPQRGSLDKNLFFEAHLMLQNPWKWIKQNWEKVDTILAPIESSKNHLEIINFLKGKREFGFALNPETPLEEVVEYLDQIDRILIMTVNPGFYGSTFLPEVLEKVRDLRKLKPSLNIEVDGGINQKTIKLARNAGANLLVSGSYIMYSKDAKESFNNLWQALES